MDAYIYQAAMCCEDCATDIQLTLRIAYVEDDGDSNHYPQGPFPDGGGEADSPQHCGSCSLFLENSLTTDGEDYVQEQIEYAEMGGSIPAVIEQWKAFYDHLTIRS